MVRRKPPPREKPEHPTRSLDRLLLRDVLRTMDEESPACSVAHLDYVIRLQKIREVISDLRDGRAVVISRALLRRMIAELQ